MDNLFDSIGLEIMGDHPLLKERWQLERELHRDDQRAWDYFYWKRAISDKYDFIATITEHMTDQEQCQRLWGEAKEYAESMVSDDPLMKRLYEVEQQMRNDPAIHWEYEGRMRVINDKYSTLVEAEERGYERGLAKVREQAKVIGIQEVASNLLQAKIDVQFISEITELPVEELEKMKPRTY